MQLCAAGSFTAVSMAVRPQFTADLFTVAVGLIRTLFSSHSAPLESLQSGSFAGDFDRRMEKGSGNGESGSSVRGSWREGSLTGDPEGYAK